MALEEIADENRVDPISPRGKWTERWSNYPTGLKVAIGSVGASALYTVAVPAAVGFMYATMKADGNPGADAFWEASKGYLVVSNFTGIGSFGIGGMFAGARTAHNKMLKKHGLSEDDDVEQHADDEDRAITSKRTVDGGLLGVGAGFGLPFLMLMAGQAAGNLYKTLS